MSEKMISPSPKELTWDEGFAAGEAAATQRIVKRLVDAGEAMREPLSTLWAMFPHTDPLPWQEEKRRREDRARAAAHDAWAAMAAWRALLGELRVARGLDLVEPKETT